MDETGYKTSIGHLIDEVILVFLTCSGYPLYFLVRGAQ